MAFIVETPQTHPGIKLYVCRAEGRGHRAQYRLEGVREKAVEFANEQGASIAIMQFSGLYGLEIVEV